MALLATAKVTTSKIPVGTFMATCTGIIEDKIENSQFNPEVYRFYFDVDGKKDDEGNQATTDAISSRAFSPKSKLWGWLEAFGLTPEVGKVMDLEQVIGRKVMIVVKQHGEYTRVEELVPPPEGMAPANDRPPLREALAEAAAQVAAETSGISDFWAATRAANLTLETVKQVAADMFGKAPADLTADQRSELLKAMDVPF